MLITTKETLKQDIDSLNDQQLKQIADFIAFLKFQSKFSQATLDVSQFASLYQQFAQEDQELAEMDMNGYTQSLENEDQL